MGRGRVVLFSVVLLGALIAQDRMDLRRFRARSFEVAEYSYSTGCLSDAMRSCAKIKEILVRGGCYEEASEKCPSSGKAFRKAMENFGKGM